VYCYVLLLADVTFYAGKFARCPAVQRTCQLCDRWPTCPGLRGTSTGGVPVTSTSATLMTYLRPAERELWSALRHVKLTSASAGSTELYFYVRNTSIQNVEVNRRLFNAESSRPVIFRLLTDKLERSCEGCWFDTVPTTRNRVTTVLFCCRYVAVQRRAVVCQPSPTTWFSQRRRHRLSLTSRVSNNVLSSPTRCWVHGRPPQFWRHVASRPPPWRRLDAVNDNQPPRRSLACLVTLRYYFSCLLTLNFSFCCTSLLPNRC